MPWLTLLLLIAVTTSAQGELRPTDVRHVKVYYKREHFCGWPTNHGIWSWGNQILVGFTKAGTKISG